MDRHTSTRVPHAKVGVYQPGASGGLGSGFVLRETYEADDLGNFAFQISDDRDDMVLRAYTDDGHYTYFQDAPKLKGGRNNKKLRVKVQAPAWVKVYIRDQAPTDIASISIQSSSGETIPGFVRYGGDTALVVSVMGNLLTKIRWEIIPVNKPKVAGSQDIFCPGMDTVPQQISY